MTRHRVWLLLLLCACSADSPRSSVEEFTRARTRIVWVQSDGSDPAALGSNLVLMGLDSIDGSERAILPSPGSYRKPLITPSGDHVVFSRGHAAPGGLEMLVVDWNGSDLRSLGAGFALAVWVDPVDGSEWVYAGIEAVPDEYDFAKVVRFRLDRPSERETVWDSTHVSSDTFQVSPDGRHAAGLFPWPHAGIAELPNGRLERIGEGCWTALASVRGPLTWYFDGAHRNLTLVDIRTSRRWTLSINGVPGFADDEVYHPRWSNHPRFLAITGPYNLGGEHRVRAGGAQTEVYLGRFREDYSAVEAWHRVTTNDAGDSYPDVWIDRKDSEFRVAAGSVGPASASVASPSKPAQGIPAQRVVIDARLTRAPQVPSPDAILPYRNALLVHEYEVKRVVEGTYEGARILVAQWVIRDRQVLPDARRAPGSAHRLTVERFEAHPELEGERLISPGDAPKLPLYYEVR
jgi:hypothetical protein